MNFEVPFDSRKSAREKFDEIADAFLNHTVLALRSSQAAGDDSKPVLKYYRICEIEFYLNDIHHHMDTYTHYNTMREETGIWYFHKDFDNEYKSETFKSLDLAIGKGGKAYGGILIKSMIPAQVISEEGQPLKLRNSEAKSDFIEGPSKCVDRILEETKPADFVEAS